MSEIVSDNQGPKRNGPPETGVVLDRGYTKRVERLGVLRTVPGRGTPKGTTVSRVVYGPARQTIVTHTDGAVDLGYTRDVSTVTVGLVTASHWRLAKRKPAEAKK